MRHLGRSLLLLGFAAVWLASASFAYSPPAKAQFFNWFNSEPAPKPRARVRPPGDDLPPIVPKESTAPPPPDDRPYDNKLMRLAEILGAVHYLRELCGAQEGQLWRDQMKEILKNEGTTAVRRAKLVNSFNRRLPRLSAHLPHLHPIGDARHRQVQHRGCDHRRLARAGRGVREQRTERAKARRRQA